MSKMKSLMYSAVICLIICSLPSVKAEKGVGEMCEAAKDCISDMCEKMMENSSKICKVKVMGPCTAKSDCVMNSMCSAGGDDKKCMCLAGYKAQDGACQKSGADMVTTSFLLTVVVVVVMGVLL